MKLNNNNKGSLCVCPCPSRWTQPYLSCLVIDLGCGCVVDDLSFPASEIVCAQYFSPILVSLSFFCLSFSLLFPCNNVHTLTRQIEGSWGGAQRTGSCKNTLSLQLCILRRKGWLCARAQNDIGQSSLITLACYFHYIQRRLYVCAQDLTKRKISPLLVLFFASSANLTCLLPPCACISLYIDLVAR